MDKVGLLTKTGPESLRDTLAFLTADSSTEIRSRCERIGCARNDNGLGRLKARSAPVLRQLEQRSGFVACGSGEVLICRQPSQNRYQCLQFARSMALCPRV